MGALIRLIAVSALLMAVPAHADEVWRWRAFVIEASGRFGIPSAWIERVMRTESAGRTTLNDKPIRSRVGAMGLMQLMPKTWGDMRVQHGLGLDPDDPRDNILAGTAYLRAMYDRFGYPGLFGAYNAGPKRYADHLTTGAALPAETIAYFSSVSDLSGQTAPASILPAPAPLFAVRRPPPVDEAPPVPTRGDGLFAVRNDAR
jgi:soluble lytic murein transglycosylase-like protein